MHYKLFICYIQIPESGKLLFNDKHWQLYKLNNKKESVVKLNMETTKVKLSDLLKSESANSSVCSGSSDHISVINKNINLGDEIGNEVDKFFGPALERTRSGSDLKMKAPLRNKRRQYRSQEVLPVVNKNILTSQEETREGKMFLKEQETNAVNDFAKKSLQTHVPIMYDNNQRAEIVASVTERLYSKLNKKGESAINKVENVVDKKIIEPLSELKICANARQRLVEISQKALKHRRKIGIPAHTQTKSRVTRVRDQGTDIQNDLEPYAIREKNNIVLYQNVGTETITMTPRCKDIGVGSQWGSLRFQDNWTATDLRRTPKISSSVMTENLPKCDQCTQTHVLPPPRKKKKKNKYLKQELEPSVSSMINIRITQCCSTDQESASTSDDNIDDESVTKSQNITMTPDLLTNHSSIETNVLEEDSTDKDHENNCNINDDIINVVDKNEKQNKLNSCIEHSISSCDNENISSEDVFSDFEEYNLPRVTVDDSTICDHKGIKDMILGRNDSLYPYNIILSPPRERPENAKRTVKFKDMEPTIISRASQTCWDSKDISVPRSNINIDDSENANIETESSKSNSTINDSNNSNISKCTDTFVWKSNPHNIDSNYLATTRNINSKNDSYQPVYQSHLSRYKNEKTRLYKEYLGLKSELNPELDTAKHNCHSSSLSEAINRIPCTANYNFKDDDYDALKDFKKKRDFFESKADSIFNQTKDPFYDFERKLLQSCDRLDECVNKYDKYLRGYQQRNQEHFTQKVHHDNSTNQKPKQYLQHLIQLRREAVRKEIKRNSVLTDC